VRRPEPAGRGTSPPEEKSGSRLNSCGTIGRQLAAWEFDVLAHDIEAARLRPLGDFERAAAFRWRVLDELELSELGARDLNPQSTFFNSRCSRITAALARSRACRASSSSCATAGVS
jgi:hypothetical protein